MQREIFHADLGNLLKQRLGLLGILVDPRLSLLEDLGTSPLDHVAKQRPGSAAEANQGNTTRQLLAGQRDGLVHVVQLLGDVDVPLHHLSVLSVLGGPEGIGEMGPFLVDHLDGHPHGLGDDQDIREDNGGIYEASESLNGLESQGGGDLGVPAAFEEVAGPFSFVVFREITASCRGIVSFAQM